MDGDEDSFVNVICTRNKNKKDDSTKLTIIATCGKSDLSYQNKNLK